MAAPRPGRLFTGYKAFYERFSDDPLPSRSEWGRFHDPSTGRSTTYLAARSSTAWREVTHRWRADAAVYRIATVQLRTRKIVDLTKRSVQKRYGIDRQVLIGEEYKRCQELARRLRADGIEAVWTYSRADQPAGRVLVVFLDRLEQPSSGIERVDVRPITHGDV
jgi:hypothetical protein